MIVYSILYLTPKVRESFGLIFPTQEVVTYAVTSHMA